MMFRPGGEGKKIEKTRHRGRGGFINHFLFSNPQRVRTCPRPVRKLVKHDTRTNRAVPCVQGTLLIERTLRILLAEIDFASIGTESVKSRRPDIVWAIGALGP